MKIIGISLKITYILDCIQEVSNTISPSQPLIKRISLTCIDYCLRQQELPTPVYKKFKSEPSEEPPYPTEHGWFSQFRDVTLLTDNLDFSDSNQLSIEFEVFPLTPYYGFYVYTYFDDVEKAGYGFTFQWSAFVAAWQKLDSFKIEEHKWNKVIFDSLYV